MNIAFTGPARISGDRVTRKFLVSLAEVCGHRVVSSVTGTTDLVVCSSPDFKDRKGRKLAAADRLGIECISPQEFLDRMEGHG